MKDRNSYQAFFFILCFMAISIVMGCASRGIVKQSQMDTPEHHYLTGSDLLDKSDLDGAFAEFEQARVLDPKYSPAYVGLGLVTVEKGNSKDAFKLLKAADRYADTNDQKIIYHIGMIRFYTKAQGDGWLDKAQEHFSEAAGIDSSDPAIYYFMALAYKKGGDYEKSSALFSKVIGLNKRYVQEADQGWEENQRILRAQPGSQVAKDIAKLDKITRADVAALFVEEMNLEKIFMKNNVPLKKTFKGDEDDDMPNDYQNHVLKADIDKVNTLGIKGLEVVGNRFDPDAEITRSDFAVMIESILVKITHDEGLATRYIDAPSPFRDVNDSYYAKNAIMTCTTRGIMKGDIYGYFKGDEPVTGADALLTIRRLNEALKY